MKIIAVVGTGSGCGKTTVACTILRAIPGLGAVKISPREGPSCVEWGAGAPGKDTDLYVGSGAVPVARILGSRDAVEAVWESIRNQFQGCPGVVVEGASALGIAEDRFVVFVVGETQEDGRDDRNRQIQKHSDVIINRSSHFDYNVLFDAIDEFLSHSSQKQV